MRVAAWRFLLVLGGTLALGGCQIGVLHPRGPIGETQRTILFNSLSIMLAIVIPTILATLFFAWWFRAGNTRARYRPTWAYSGRIELVTWSIPVLVIIFLGGIAWIGSHDLDPAKPIDSQTKPLRLQVVALDWKWLFIYPDQGVATVNQLVVPVGTPLNLEITSASVMNAFFIPQLGSMIYAMNGMATRLHLQADQPGTYAGLSSHFSGDGFSGMNFKVDAVATDAFDRWVAEAKAATGKLDLDAYTALSRQSSNVAPALLRLEAPDLFHDIVMQHIPPAPGPEAKAAPSVPSATEQRNVR